MKKQITVIISVALAAILLFVSYIVFFKDDGIEEVGDPFYTLTDNVKTTLGEIENEVEINLCGYDADDEGWEMIYLFSQSIIKANKEFSLTTSENSVQTVRVSVSDGGSKEIAYNDFFRALYDGTRFAFNGESLIANAIFEVCGMETLEISLRALSGYDIDGDTVAANGNPFLFPSVQRSQIAFLSIENSHGRYSIYQDSGDFYFSSSRALAYNDDMFALLTTNCRYSVALGKLKMPEDKSWADYGLDASENTSANYTLMTNADKNGNYTLHTVYIGKASSTGSYYYARYIGGIFQPAEKEGGEDKMVQNLSKDFIYFLPVSYVTEAIGLPETDILEPSIINEITNTEEIYTIDDIHIDFIKEGISAVAKNMGDFNPAPNLSVVDNSAITTVLSDKVHAKDYSEYSKGWKDNIDVFAGFTSSDGKTTYIEAALAKTAPNGNYAVDFGLLRDEANGAFLPSKITLMKSYDGVNWHEIEDGIIEISHSDKKLHRYQAFFTDERTVKYIRIIFPVPQKENSYVVFDEIRIYADGVDAQPLSSIYGQWKFTAPDEYIPEGMNYTFVDMTTFNDFVTSIVSLQGECVVACGIGKDGDATSLNTELLAKFGLDNPEKHFSFEYDGVVTDMYVSAPNEQGKYYAYTTFKGSIQGVSINATTDVIVELSVQTAPWLAWDMVSYLDHSLFSIYIAEITEFDITVDGVEHKFFLSLDEEGALSKITYNGESMHVRSFQYLYQTINRIKMRDEYIPEEGELGEEYLRIKIHTETNSPEIVFYRVSASKCYFTVNGEGGYYALTTEVDAVRKKLEQYLSGAIITG